MRRLHAPTMGLIGRVVAILFIALAIEFAASTLLYERASRFAVRGDEAHRLAEHLVIARRLVTEVPAEERAQMAAELTTDRYDVRWTGALPAPPPIAPELDAMKRQVVTWEPSLGGSDLRMRLLSPGRRSAVSGGLRLDDGTWLHFSTRAPVATATLALDRVALAMVPAIALMILGATLLRRSLQPLRALAEAADRFAGGGAAPVAEDGSGEVRRVIAAFNRMQNRIRVLIEERTQALAAVSHDLRTPLARLRLRSDAITDAADRDAAQRDIDEMEAMVGSLLAFLRGADEPEAAVMVDLAALCETVADDAADQGSDVVYAGPDHHERRVRRLALKRALANLVDNARRYGDRVRVVLTAGEDGAVAIAVEDDGPGIPPDKLTAVLEPFVRLDPARGRDGRGAGGHGFGLGLAIAAQAAAGEGGRLVLANRAEGGLCAIIHLPPPPGNETSR